MFFINLLETEPLFKYVAEGARVSLNFPDYYSQLLLPHRAGPWYFAPMALPVTPRKALVVLAHPATTGFNQAIADQAVAALKQNFDVDFLDLYRESFDPVIPGEELPRKFSFDETVLRFQGLVEKAEVLVFVHPDWWGGMPAILKGFIDRVFRPGVAYEYDGYEFLSKKKKMLFTGKKAFVFSTTDYAAPQGDDPTATIWKRNIFSYCGINDAQIHTFYDTYNSTYEARHHWIESVGQKITGALT